MSFILHYKDQQIYSASRSHWIFGTVFYNSILKVFRANALIEMFLHFFHFECITLRHTIVDVEFNKYIL